MMTPSERTALDVRQPGVATVPGSIVGVSPVHRIGAARMAVNSVSAVIIARNEEADIERTLASLAFTDEIVVVDGGSTDRTVEIAREHGARTFTHPFEGFGAQRRWATAQATHDWVLSVDADEVVTPELAEAVQALFAAGEPPCAAYRLRFQMVFMGRPFTHGRLARESHVRLFDRRRAGWDGALVHEGIRTDGAVGELPGLILHHSVRDLSEAITKLNAYSSLGAQELRRVRRRAHPLKVLALGPFHFVRHWILYGNWRNGVPGLAWSILNAVGSMMKHLKAQELGEVR